MISPDDAINSLLDENLPKSVEERRNAEKLPFPGSATGHGNSKLPRYSQIEVLSPTGNNESVEKLPAYPGNSAEFVQPPAPNSALQIVCVYVCMCMCMYVHAMFVCVCNYVCTCL